LLFETNANGDTLAPNQTPATNALTTFILKHARSPRERTERCKGRQKKILPGGCAVGRAKVEILF
jgi:hypothetical protein